MFFLAPMDEAAIAIITDIPEHSHLFWVGSNAVRNRYLSLLDKVDAVLAHDTATALLPTFMDRHCVTEVSVGHDVALCLTDVANYVHGGFRSNFETMRSPLLHHYLERGLISERCFTAEQLENSIQGYRRDLCIGINWDSQVRECWRTRSARKKSSARKKLRKLLRDPYKYCDDSKNRFVRFCRIFFEK